MHPDAPSRPQCPFLPITTPPFSFPPLYPPALSTSPNKLASLLSQPKKKAAPLHYSERCPPPLAFLPSECPLFPILHPIHSCGAGGQLTGHAWNRCGGSGD